MLILAYMLKLNHEWEHARIHIHAVVENEDEKEILSGDIKKSLKESHIPASVDILINKNQPFFDVLKEQSTDADIVFLGLKVTDRGNEEKHAKQIAQLAEVGKLTVFVQNNSLKEHFPILLRSEKKKT